MTEETKNNPVFLRYQEQSMLRFKEEEPPPETGKFWACVAVGGFFGIVAFAFGNLGSGAATGVMVTFLLWALVKRGK